MLGLFVAFYLQGIKALLLVAALTIIEITLSFDNAVVNAKYLKNMTEIWQKRFLTWGVFIAVFGMRILFPILIVYGFTDLNIKETIDLSLYEPHQYELIVTSSKPYIMMFGGSFLLLTALDFFLNSDDKKDMFKIEKFFKELEIDYLMKHVLVFSIALSISVYIKDPDIFISGLLGLALYQALQLFDSLSTDTVLKNGLASFMYLELLDASFSFDGVLTAFAVTNQFLIIAIGLGVGALFVRSMTIYLLKENTLKELPYLENGAFYSILFISICMLLQTNMHIPEFLIATISLGFIALSVTRSFKK